MMGKAYDNLKTYPLSEEKFKVTIDRLQRWIDNDTQNALYINEAPKENDAFEYTPNYEPEVETFFE